MDINFIDPNINFDKHPPISKNGCQADFDDLLSLAKECIEQSSGFEEYLKDWLVAMGELKKIQNLETLETEQNLEQLAWILRYQWLRYSSLYAHGLLKSPIQGPYKKTVSGAPFRYPYDRWSKPKYLEKRCIDLRPIPKKWHGEHLLFASGMSAVNAAIQYCRTRLNKSSKIDFYEFGGYFEYERLFRYISDTIFNAKICQDHSCLIEIVENSKSDILMIEPVASQWPLEVLDMVAFKRAWIKAKKVPYAVIVDTSLTGGIFPMSEFLNLLSERPAMVIELSSGLKLDQVGLELANAGILSMYLPVHIPLQNRKAQLKRLTRIRRTLGLSATLNEFTSLEFPAFLNRTHQIKHIKSVFANNAFFARSINNIGKGIFAEIAHPSLSKNLQAWAGAPFVLLRMYGTGEENEILIKMILQKEANKRGLCFSKGSSFGFRSHRFEMGIGGSHDTTGIRIALGSRSGPSLDGLIELFNKIGSFPNFAELRTAFM